jgi:hypothetical protein
VEGAVFSLSAPAPAATAGTSSGAGRVLEELGIGSGAARLELDLGGERRPWGLRDRETARVTEREKIGTHIWRGE